jgi:hypothetical protein
MKRRLLMTLSWVALAGLAALPLLFLFRVMDQAPMIRGLNLATLIWFATAPFWMGGNRES